MLPPWRSRPARSAPGTMSPPGLPSLCAPSLGHSRGALSHRDVGWALPLSCKEGFTLNLLLAWVLLSKRVAGPCFVAVLLCCVSSFLARCVREVADG